MFAQIAREWLANVAGVFHDTRTPNPRLQMWLSTWETWRCDAEEYIENGDTIVVLARYQSRRLIDWVERTLGVKPTLNRRRGN